LRGLAAAAAAAAAGGAGGRLPLKAPLGQGHLRRKRGRLLEVVRPRKHLRNDLRVRVGEEAHATAEHELSKRGGARDLPVVCNRELPQVRFQHKGLRAG